MEEKPKRKREREKWNKNIIIISTVSSIVFVVDIVKIEYENNKQTIYSNNTHVDD